MMLFNLKNCKWKRKRGTLCLMRKGYGVVIQISIKDPWWLPHKELHCYENGMLQLYGWLFFYVGTIREGEL